MPYNLGEFLVNWKQVLDWANQNPKLVPQYLLQAIKDAYRKCGNSSCVLKNMNEARAYSLFCSWNPQTCGGRNIA